MTNGETNLGIPIETNVLLFVSNSWYSYDNRKEKLDEVNSVLGGFYYFLTKINHFQVYFVQCCSLYESGCILAAQNKQNNLKTAGWHKLLP